MSENDDGAPGNGFGSSSASTSSKRSSISVCAENQGFRESDSDFEICTMNRVDATQSDNRSTSVSTAKKRSESSCAASDILSQSHRSICSNDSDDLATCSGVKNADLGEDPDDDESTTSIATEIDVPFQEVRRLLARFKLGDHAISEDYANEAWPDIWCNFTKSREHQRQSRAKLKSALNRINATLKDPRFHMSLKEGAAWAQNNQIAASKHETQKTRDMLASVEPGQYWREQQYLLDGIYRW